MLNDELIQDRGDDIKNGPISVLLVDFRPVVREGLRCILDQADRFSVVGEAPDQQSALRTARELHPEVVLSELRSEGLNGFQLIRELRDEFPEVAIIVITQSERERDITEAIGAGANGYLIIDNITEESLPAAISLSMSNISALDSDLVYRVISNIRERARMSLINAGALGADLTDRELEVLRLMASGYADGEIASTLTISINTVNRHVRNIVEKLGAGNRTRAALLAAAAGIIEISLDQPQG
jgi:NarL family two-component system response regulator LiaR